MYIQNQNGQFNEVKLPQAAIKQSYLGHWRNVRVGFITKRELPDLAVVEGSGSGPYYFKIFQSKETAPHFAFHSPYYVKRLPYAPADLELLDFDKNGFVDVYISQANERKGYCAGK